MALGINLVCADRVGESVVPDLTRAREPVPQSAGGRPRRCCPTSRPAARTARSRELGRQVGLRPERSRRCRSSCCRAATSRRSWSAAGCTCTAKIYVFEDPTAGVDVGAKAEIYRLFDVALQARRGDPHRLDRFRGSRQGLPSRAGVRPRPRRRRAGRRRSVGREPARRGLRQRRPDGRARDPPRTASRRTCNPSSPTPSSRPGSELARPVALAAGRAPPAGLRPADPDASLLIVFFSILLPRPFPT